MAFRRLLVPLDGSALAEAALPAASHLALVLGASVTLVHVIERHPPERIHGERHLATREEAEAYLADIARGFQAQGITVEPHVHAEEVPDVARSIVEHIGELGPDLIVMCTHGVGGLRGWIFGSIAQQVVAMGPAPVLLIRPAAAAPAAAFTCGRILLPLDQDPGHEQGLPVALELAQRCRAALHLLMVVHTWSTLPGVRAAVARLLPRTSDEILEIRTQEGEGYLDRLLAEIRAQGLTATARVARGDPVRAIVRAARRLDVDLIVLGTHGRRGVNAFWEGSIPPRVSARSRLPLLIVPSPEA
jgi:nucleotide-binding universal stress UspA family protein